MSETDFGFKFAIGDDVVFAASAREAATINAGDIKFKSARPQRFTVQERILQQCYGGIQRHYKVRGTAPVGSFEVIIGVSGGIDSSGFYTATENELAPAVKESAPVADPPQESR